VTAANKTRAPNSSNIETTLHQFPGKQPSVCTRCGWRSLFSVACGCRASAGLETMASANLCRNAIRSDRRRPTPSGNGPACGRDSGSAAKNMNRKADPQRPRQALHWGHFPSGRLAPCCSKVGLSHYRHRGFLCRVAPIVPVGVFSAGDFRPLPHWNQRRPVDHARRPGRRENALILDGEFHIQPLAPIIGIARNAIVHHFKLAVVFFSFRSSITFAAS
jgi:hypothetical protein